MANFGRFDAGKDSGPPSVGDQDADWKWADRPARWSRFQPELLDHINMLGRQSDAKAVLITPSVNVSEKQEKLPVFGSTVQRSLNLPTVPYAPNQEQYGALPEDLPLVRATEMSNPAPNWSSLAPYLTVDDKADQVPYATAETRGLRITPPQFTAPPQASPLARQPELAGMPPQITPQPLQQPDMAQSEIPPDLDSRLKEILAATATPEPVRSDVGGGLKFQPLPFAPPPQAERELGVVNVPPPPDIQPRGGIRPLSAATGALMRLPQIKTDIPAVARSIQEGKPVQANNTTVTKSMPPAIAPLLQPEHKTGNRVVVSLADKRVVVYGPDGIMRGTFPVFIGSSKDPTPEGQFRILENMTPGPSEWYYGGHWLGFATNIKNPSADYMGFHGWTYTKDDDDEEKVNPGWKTQTHGCVQLDNKDIRKFASMLGAGDPVTIVKAHLTVPGVQKPRLPGM